MAVTVTVPPSTTKLIALADLKAILGIADSANDTLLGNIIQRGSDAVARFCNRVFAQRTVIETLPGPGGQLLKLKFAPIVTLTSIALDGETVDPDTYTLTEPDGVSANCLHGFGRFNGSGAILVMWFDRAVWMSIAREDRGFLTTHLHGGYGIRFFLMTRDDLTSP